MEKLLYCEGSQTMVQITHRGCGVSILGDVQNPREHSLDQSTLADHASAGA